MKTGFSLLLFIIFCAALFAQPDWQWIQATGGITNDYARDMDTDAAGNVYVTGFFTGNNVSFGSSLLTGYADIFVGKLDPAGNWLWAVQAEGAGVDTADAIATDINGNSYITGCFAGSVTFGSTTLTSSGPQDIYVAKLDGSGNWLWATRAGGTDMDRGLAIGIDGAGNSYVTGYFTNGADFGPYSVTGFGGWDVFAAKLDTNGNWLWAGEAGGPGSDCSRGISVDDSGNFWIVGEFEQTAVFAGNYLTSMGGLNSFVAMVGTDQEMVWIKRLGSISTVWASGVDHDTVGNCYITGGFNETAFFSNYTQVLAITSLGQFDAFVAKIKNDGAWLWAVSGGGTESDLCRGISLDGSGNVFISGYFSNNFIYGGTSISGYGSFDILLAKLDTDGNWIWASAAGGSGSDYMTGIKALPNGRGYVTGYFESTASFGPFQRTSAGETDIFIAKLGLVSIPMPPENVIIVTDGVSISLSWDPVTQDTDGNPITPTHYSIYHSITGPEGPFTFFAQTSGTSFYTAGWIPQPLEFFDVRAVLLPR